MNKATRNELRKLIWAEQSWRGAYALCELGMSLPEDEPDINYSVMSGIVVSYARAFMSGEGLGPVDNAFEEFESRILQENHQRLLLMRNKIFGHKDDLWERSKLKDIERYYLTITESGQLSSQVVGIHSEPCQAILDLISFQRERCKSRFQSLVEKHISLKLEFGAGSYEIKDDPPYIRRVNEGEDQASELRKKLAAICDKNSDLHRIIPKEGDQMDG